MNDDELTRRLAETLRAEASTVASPPDAWERFSESTVKVVPLRSLHERRLWLGAPVAVIGVAAAIALVVMVVQHGSNTTNVAASSSAASSPAPGDLAAGRPGAPPSPSAAATAAGTGAPAAGAATGAVAAGGAAGSASGAGSGVGSAGPSVAGGTAGAPTRAVPAGFHPQSVTFVSAQEGWVLGTASCSTPPCASIVRTTDGGATWVAVPAPADALATSINANSGVSEIRFATPLDGWAYGPDLWVTHSGGATWHRITLVGGGAVSSLEASAGIAYASVLDPTSAQVKLFASPVASDGWVAQPVSIPIGAGPVPTTQLVLHGASGWLLQNDRTVVGGARLVNGRWEAWTPPCATAQGPAVLAASSSTDLVAVCDVGLWGGTSAPVERLYDSHDGGTSFSQTSGTVPGSADAGAESGVASPAPGTVVVASADALYRSADDGRSWSTPLRAPQSAWRDLGFTTPSQGVVVGSGTSAGPTLFVSHDGGRAWAPVTF